MFIFLGLGYLTTNQNVEVSPNGYIYETLPHVRGHCGRGGRTIARARGPGSLLGLCLLVMSEVVLTKSH